MRIGFAGTPAFAATALKAILDPGNPVVVVLSQPDRPHGRGLKTEPGPVAALARTHGIALLQPRSLKSEEERAPLAAVALDVLVVAAYGLILPRQVLDWPKHGCINIHASLLPRWRGAAPIQRALLAGDAETGISIMRMDAGLDTGPVISQHRIPIAARETAGTLHDKLAAAGGQAIVATLATLARDGRLAAQPQAGENPTYAAKLAREETVVDWTASAQRIDRVVRALNPAPGAGTQFEGVRLKIWDAEPAPGRFGTPGIILRADAAGILIACGEGALLVRELQPASGRRMSAAAFLAGHPLTTNARVGAAIG
jgi:methionyl-tRNA formyltransferase